MSEHILVRIIYIQFSLQILTNAKVKTMDVVKLVSIIQGDTSVAATQGMTLFTSYHLGKQNVLVREIANIYFSIVFSSLAVFLCACLFVFCFYTDQMHTNND